MQSSAALFQSVSVLYIGCRTIGCWKNKVVSVFLMHNKHQMELESCLLFDTPFKKKNTPLLLVLDIYIIINVFFVLWMFLYYFDVWVLGKSHFKLNKPQEHVHVAQLNYLMAFSVIWNFMTLYLQVQVLCIVNKSLFTL